MRQQLQIRPASRIATGFLACLAALALAMGLAFAAPVAPSSRPADPGSENPRMPTPVANGAMITPRAFNDCPSSVLDIVNEYPARIVIDEDQITCYSDDGWGANRHYWEFSPNAGHDPVILQNNDAFRFGATIVLDGTDWWGEEAGLVVRPAWNPYEGQFMVRLWDGEISCFGGMLPFYHFTWWQGLSYTAGEPITLEITYLPNSSTYDAAGTIEYRCIYQGNTYSSGPLPIGCPPEWIEGYGCWGILNGTRVGGYSQNRLTEGYPDAHATATFSDIYWNKSPGQPWSGGSQPARSDERADPKTAVTQLELALLGSQPVRGATRIGFALPKAADVSLQLYDVAGRRAATVAAGGYPAGRTQLSFDTSTLPAGVYVLRLTADGVKRDRRMVITP